MQAGFKPVHAKVKSTGLVVNRIGASIKGEILLVLADGVTAQPAWLSPPKMGKSRDLSGYTT
jgi:hypothetical protein